MIWKFTFIDSTNTPTVIDDEPDGWDGVSFSFTRNINHHGIFNSIDTNGLEWIDEAHDLLYTEYLTNGANGFMLMKSEYKCEPNDDYTTYFIGKFDFNTFKRQCGDKCFITCDITSSNCVDIWLSRMNQDVNPDNTTNFDGDTITACPNEDLLINGQTILLQNKADNNSGTNYTTTITDNSWSTGNRFYDIPVYLPNNQLFEIGDWNVNNVSPIVLAKNGGLDNISFPLPDGQDDFDNYFQFMYLYAPNNDECVTQLQVNWRAKGSFKLTPNYNGNITVTLRAYRRNPITNADFVDLGSVAIGTTIALSNGIQTSINFDETFSGLPNQPVPGSYIVFAWHLQIFKSSASATDTTAINIDYDGGSLNYFNMTTDSACDLSHAKSYLLPDLLEHFPKVYYSDTCPQVEIETDLRACLNKYAITKGSMIREVTEPNSPNLFLSYEYLFSNINKIFNIGWGFDQNDSQITIGRPDVFYKNDLVVFVGEVDMATFTTASDLIWGSVAIGYNKWEAEEYNGLDEMNTERYYRRNVNSNDNEKDLMTDIIAAGYTIEITRRKNQGKTGTSDWRYDDDLFIINCFDDGGQLTTVNGVEASPSGIYSPSTRLNYALTPARNMMRWFKSICAANPTIANDQLIFTKGTGNYLCQGQMLSYCPIEGNVINESQTITTADFDNPFYITPDWQPIYATFKAPLGMEEFEDIKANPYGKITFNCGGDLYNGNIVTLNHDPKEGMGDFKLILRPN